MELLISLKNRGKIVYTQYDFLSWGKEECLDKFVVVRVQTNKSKSELLSKKNIETGEDKYFFDLDDAFTDAEWSEMQNSDWQVFEKDESFIKENF
jgi:hypothetical protein